MHTLHLLPNFSDRDQYQPGTLGAAPACLFLSSYGFTASMARG